MIVEISALTNEGRVRTNNEDSWDIVAQNWSGRNNVIEVVGNGILLAVADGMGGSNAGEIASKIAIETFRKEFLAFSPNNNTSRWRFLENIVKKAHHNILTEATRNLNYMGMGTTAVLAWLIDDTAYIAWCGDSRCYLYRDNKELIPITDDHSMVWEEVKKGNMTAEQARLSDESNIILQSLGDPNKTPKPESRVIPIKQGDCLMLCSDGLNGMLSDTTIQKIIGNQDNKSQLLCAQLVEAANAAGGRDNVTTIIAKVTQGKEIAEAISSPKPSIEEDAPMPAKKTEKNLLMLLATGLLALSMAAAYFFFKPAEKRTIDFSENETQLVEHLNKTLAPYNIERKKILNNTDKIIACGFEKEILNVNRKHGAIGELVYPFGLDYNSDKSYFILNKSSKTKEINANLIASADSLILLSKKGIITLTEQYNKKCGNIKPK